MPLPGQHDWSAVAAEVDRLDVQQRPPPADTEHLCRMAGAGDRAQGCGRMVCRMTGGTQPGRLRALLGVSSLFLNEDYSN